MTSSHSHSKFSLAKFAKIHDPKHRQALAVELFNQAMEADDALTACDVANYVIGQEQPVAHFSASFQMHCLAWLTRHYRQAYSQTADGSTEEELYLDKLFETLWKFKWIVPRLPLDINMTLAEISQANDLMRDLYQFFEFGLSAMSKTLMHQSIEIGDVQAAKQHFHDWQNTPNDDGSDCEACEQHSLVQYYHFIGDYKKVVELAQPIISGEMTCGEVPHLTYQYVIDSLIRLQKKEQASDLLSEAIDLITDTIDDHLHLLAPLIYLQTRLGQMQSAKDLLDDFNDEIVAHAFANRMYYLNYLICVAPFNDEALMEAKKVAQQLDERNGNSHYQDKLTLMFEQVKLH